MQRNVRMGFSRELCDAKSYLKRLKLKKKRTVVTERIVCFDLKNESFQFVFYLINVVHQNQASKIETKHLDPSVSFQVPIFWFLDTQICKLLRVNFCRYFFNSGFQNLINSFNVKRGYFFLL